MAATRKPARAGTATPESNDHSARIKRLELQVDDLETQIEELLDEVTSLRFLRDDVEELADLVSPRKGGRKARTVKT